MMASRRLISRKRQVWTSNDMQWHSGCFGFRLWKTSATYVAALNLSFHNFWAGHVGKCPVLPLCKLGIEEQALHWWKAGCICIFSQYRKCLKNRRGSTWDLYLSCSGGSIEPLSFRRWQPHQPRRGDQFRMCNAILLKFYFFDVCGTWIRVDSHLDWDVFRWTSMGSIGVSCTITHHEPQTSWPLNSVDQDLLKCSVPCKLIFRTSSVRRLVCSLPLALWVVVMIR